MAPSQRLFRSSRTVVMAGVCTALALGPGLAGTAAATARPTAPAIGSTTEWPQFRAGPTHTGAVVDPVLTPAALSRLSVTWRLGESGEMAVSGGLLYLAQPGQVTAVRVSDGSVAWRTSLPGYREPRTPAVSGGVLVVAGGYSPRRLGIKGGAWGLDASTGRLLWQRQFPFLVYAAPTITKTFVLVSWVDGMSKLRLADGGVSWTSKLPMSGSPATNGSIVVGADVQGQPPYDVHALDLATGALRWSKEVDAPSSEQGNPVLGTGTGTVFTSTSGSLVAHRTKTGSQAWAIPASGYGLPTDPPALAGDRLIEADTHEIWGVDTTTGAVVWRADSGANSYSPADPVVIGSTVVVPLSNNPFLSVRSRAELQMRDVQTGVLTGSLDLISSIAPDASSITGIIAAEGHLFVAFSHGPQGETNIVELSPS